MKSTQEIVIGKREIVVTEKKKKKDRVKCQNNWANSFQEIWNKTDLSFIFDSAWLLISCICHARTIKCCCFVPYQ